MLRSQAKTEVDPPVQGSDPALVEQTSKASRRLLEAMMHEARNPLNAISIHLEVLAEKVRKAGLPTRVDGNLQAIREQLARVDGILKSFSEFLLPRPSTGDALPISALVERAIELVSYECRRKGVRICSQIEPGLFVRASDGSLGPTLVLAPLLRALDHAANCSEVRVGVSSENGIVAVIVIHSRIGEVELGIEDTSALEALSRQAGGKIRIGEGECRLTFPGVQPS